LRYVNHLSYLHPSYMLYVISKMLYSPTISLVLLVILPTKLSCMLFVTTGLIFLALLAKYFPRIPPFLLLPPKATLTLSGKASDLPNPSPPPTLLPLPLVPSSAPSPFPLPLPQMMQSPGRSRGRTGQLRTCQVVSLSGQGMGWSIYW
jgi:hypothetical protein